VRVQDPGVAIGVKLAEGSGNHHETSHCPHPNKDQAVNIGERLRALRKEKKLLQRDIAKKTGLLRCNLWRLEIGRQVPTIETLEKIARALEVPMYQLFYFREGPRKLPNLRKRMSAKDNLWGNSGKDAHMLAEFCHLFSRMKESDLGLLLFVAQKMVRRKPA
jgi:transcriptional regulator with XRE-family HTH domain